MGFFNRSVEPNEVTVFKMISETGNGFYSWDGKLYQSDIIRSAIRPTSRAIGKLVPKHIRKTGEDLQVNPEVYMKFLLEEPNPFMTGQVMQEKIANQLLLNNNAFIAIVRDENGLPMQLYPIPSTSVQTKYDSNDQLMLEFNLTNGTLLKMYYADIIHLRRDFNENELFGTSPATALVSVMDVVTTTDQGIVKAVQNSTIIKWLLKFKQVLQDEDIEAQLTKFVNNYMSMDATTVGVAPTDPRYELEQVKPEAYIPNAAQMDRSIDRVYNFFNTNKKIIQSNFTEDEWNSYFESEIEPVGMQMSGEYSRKLFSRKQRGFGNRIVFDAMILQYASMSNKLNLLQMVDRGAMTPNEWRAIMNMGPIEGGDKPIRRLDTAVVNE